ncbi:MAG: replicative DNA helicase, partial [Planctomycetota bacterium]
MDSLDAQTRRRQDASHASLVDRTPPHDEGIERQVLGSILIDPDVLDDVIPIVHENDFYVDAHRRIYHQLVEMHSNAEQIDVVLLTDRLKRAGELEAVGGAAYLAEIVGSVAHAAHATHYATIVRNYATARALIHAGTEIVRESYDLSIPPESLVNRAEERVFAVRNERSPTEAASMEEVLVDAFEEIDHMLEHGGAVGVPTGFVDLDKMTGGLHESELIILAARPSMGKTAFATNIADYVSVEAQATTLFVSLEMSRIELAKRMLCSRGKLNGQKFRSGFLSASDREKLVEAVDKLNQAKLYIDDNPSRTVTEIAATARRLKRKDDLKLIIIDYLQLIEPENPRDPRQEQVAKMTRRLKVLARELKVPIICLAQLNRQTEIAKDNRPRLSHLRESGAIEQDADVVMFVHREEYYHKREEAEAKGLVGIAEIIVAKQRNGPVGDVKLAWRHEYTKFENLAPDEMGDYTYEGDS